MSSIEEEKVSFSKIVKARGNVENWLLQVEQAMILAVKHHMRAAIVEYLPFKFTVVIEYLKLFIYETKPREQWIMEFPAQVVLTASQIFWCRDVEACLQSNDPLRALENYKKTCEENLEKLAGKYSPIIFIMVILCQYFSCRIG